MSTYFKNIAEGIQTVLQGMKLTISHFAQARHLHSPTNVQHPDYFSENNGIVTLQYPKEKIPVPDHGRYQLHNEMDDCIVCDKCAVICPVDCIDIEPIKSSEAIGTTSDGSVKRLYAAKFDIDMAKCCFCGLCTSVCPTECLTMTSEYDFSTFKISDMNFKFGNLSEKEAEEKKKLYEQFVKEKEEAKQKIAVQTTKQPEISNPVVGIPKISIPKPAGLKPIVKPISEEENKIEEVKPIAPPKISIPKPAGLKPIVKPISEEENKIEEAKPIAPPKIVIPKPAGLKPIVKPISEEENKTEEVKPIAPPKIVIPKPAGLKPIVKPIIQNPENE